MGSDAQDWALVFFFFFIVCCCCCCLYCWTLLRRTLLSYVVLLARMDNPKTTSAQNLRSVSAPPPTCMAVAGNKRKSPFEVFHIYIFFSSPGICVFSFILRIFIFIFIIIIFLRSRFVYLLGLLLFFPGGSGRRRRQFGWLDLLTPFPLFSSSYSLPVSVLLIRLRKPRVSVLS